uniref:Solute carrier family 22 member 23 n=1 Tax=Sus scrofa TaxID=9823 RepID=A0A8D0VMN6_PIG
MSVTSPDPLCETPSVLLSSIHFSAHAGTRVHSTSCVSKMWALQGQVQRKRPQALRPLSGEQSRGWLLGREPAPRQPPPLGPAQAEQREPPWVAGLPVSCRFPGKLEKELSRRPKKVCIVKVVGTRNLWKNIVVLCVNSLTGFGIHHCFARSMMGHEVKVPLLENFYADYYTAAGIALASCLAMCLVVGVLGRRGGLLLFMILTALASLLQLGLLNLIGKYSQHPDSGMSDSVKDKFSVTFSIVGMFASHAAGSLSVFFCAEITPTVIRCGGLGLVLASAGFGMLTAPIIELHNQKGYFLHHIIFACCTLICIICLLLLPESRDQNLPESIADGEHYTRQPLLPPRRGEQPLLLTNAELKDYSGLHDAAAAGDGLPDGATANGGRPM